MKNNSLLYSILIPAYNESQNIGPTLEGLAAALRKENIPFELLVVNDNSTDDTAEVLDALSTSLPELHIVNNTPPGGLGRAVRCGLAHFKGDVVA
ncbi:MAG: glycosyltransferase family 2 protein, partial [Candidatus Hydrogenedentes bacterium]|nr:glycosyltransferase family 2 protein [Candidatus Hydrogenedentota bacterium]